MRLIPRNAARLKRGGPASHGGRHQRGQSMFELVVVVVIMTALAAIVIRFIQYEATRMRANAYGQDASQMAVGTRGYIAGVQDGTAAPGTYAGVNWLKPPACGGLASNPAAGYVPCSYSGGALGSSYSTTVTLDPVTKTAEARTSFLVPIDTTGPAGLASFAAMTAQAARAQQTLPANGTFYSVFANAPVTATSQPAVGAIAAADRGRVLVVVSNAPSQDIFLRTDGTNQMLADLNVGGNSIANAKNGTYSGTVSTDVLNASGGINDSGTLGVSGQATMYGNLTVNGSSAVQGNSWVAGDTTLNKSLHVMGWAKVDSSLEVDGDLWMPSGATAHLQGPVIQGVYGGANNVVISNGVVAANDVNLGSIGRYASQGFYNWQTLVLNSAANVAKPNCSAVAGGTSTPRIIAMLQGTGSVSDTVYGGSAPLTNSQVAVNDMGSYWQLVPTINGVQYQMTTSVGGGGTTVNFTKTARSGSGMVVTYLVQCG